MLRPARRTGSIRKLPVWEFPRNPPGVDQALAHLTYLSKLGPMLDKEVAEVLGYQVYPPDTFDRQPFWAVAGEDSFFQIPPYTTCIDAAMLLADDDWLYTFEKTDWKKFVVIFQERKRSGGPNSRWKTVRLKRGVGASLPAAICAAVIKMELYPR